VKIKNRKIGRLPEVIEELILTVLVSVFAFVFASGIGYYEWVPFGGVYIGLIVFTICMLWFGYRRVLESRKIYSEQKKAEKALRESEEKYRLLADNSRDIICLHSADSRYVYLSPSCSMVLGYDPEELIGTDPWELVHPDDLKPMQEIAGKKTLEGKSALMAYRIRKKSGDYIWVESVSQSIIGDEGEIIGFVTSSRDITERIKVIDELRSSERLLCNVIDASPNCIFIKDKEGRYLLANKAIADLYGTVPENMIGKTDSYFAERGAMRTEECGLFREQDLQVIKSRKPLYISEEKITTKEGAVRWFQTTKIPISHMDDPDCVLGVAVDITERKGIKDELKEAYLELKEIQDQLIQTEKLAALGRFASSIAHEIKNPLGTILGGIEFLERKIKVDDKDIDIAIEKIKDTILKADYTMMSLLKFARPSELKRERISPNVLVENAASLLRYEISLNNIRIEHDFGRGIFIDVDRNLIEQVIFNILINAVEAMPDGGTIVVKTSRRVEPKLSPDKPFCAIEITDTGEGIPEENLSRLFEPFFTTKKEMKGTGLGLPTSKTITQNHGGDIFIESEYGKGTTVKIILPLAEGGR